MNKLKFFQYSTILLLLLNVGFVLFGMRHPPNGSAGLAEKIVEELSLDDSQKKAFLDMGKAHHEAMIRHNEEQKTALNKYFQHLPSDYAEEVSADLLGEICQIEEGKIELTYRHFQAVHELLNEDQKELYTPVINEALSGILMLPKKRMK